jgi:hypothetical protein
MNDFSRRSLIKAAAVGALGFPAAAQRPPVGELAPRRPGRRPRPDAVETFFERVTLEVSLKPFHNLEQGAVEAVCEHIFRQWGPLIRHTGGCAIMLWTADGSEILDYRGRMGDEIEWGRYIGVTNPPPEPPATDPRRDGIHAWPWLYMDDPPKITYADLRRIVGTLKKVGLRMTGRPVEVGATFDPGPEFAISPFKYQRHPEISPGGTMGRGTWVSCSSLLNADDVPYAGFPKGIPQGTPFGVFLGRQSRYFLTDLGFDYIWFSNGFGFALETWAVKGQLFDGERFDATQARRIGAEVIGFWKHFREECPRFRIETRGTNLSVGADLSAHGSPVKEIYDGGFDMIAPPNSPWAAINGDFGIELVGYLSRISHLPANGKFPFRFYTHDPWFLNSPWFDRYGRNPHDIYIPLGVARLDAAGKVTRPAYLEFLTIDSSFGEMPDRCPIEVTPHILRAMDSYADEPGPVTWIYPFAEYHRMTFGASPRLGEVFFGDWFMRGAVNAGFPLNTVVSTENFVASYAARPGMYRETVLLATVPEPGSAVEKSLLDAVRRGHDVLFYGPVGHAGASLLELLNLAPAAPLAGELEWSTSLPADGLGDGALPRTIDYRGLLSGGGVDTVLRNRGLAGSRECATVSQGGQERAFAVLRERPFGAGSGRVGWFRGCVSCSIAGGHLPVPDDPRRRFLAEALLRRMLALFGYEIFIDKRTVDARDPLILVSRSGNGFWLSGYAPSTTTTVRMRFRHGAPLPVGAETWIENGYGAYTMQRAWRSEVRCLVEQKEPGEISCNERHSGHVGIRRRILLRGFKDATIHFYPETRKPGRKPIMVLNDARNHTEDSIPYSVEDNGRRLTARGVTGELLISW